jgi:hypothetical protein
MQKPAEAGVSIYPDSRGPLTAHPIRTKSEHEDAPATTSDSIKII